MTKYMILPATVAVLALFGCTAEANEAVIRKNVGASLPEGVKIDEVRPAPVSGLWELRIGNEIRYTDATGQYLIEGEILDLKARRNLTQDRIEKITAISFASLPLKDAIVWKKGDGSRRIAVFADPNCGYCKRFERSLQDVPNLTVYTFVIPILGGDSPDKAKAAWCAKDKTTAWRSWMLEGAALPKPEADCDPTAVERNMALAQKIRVNGTPAVIFEDGTRAPGAITAEQVEKRLQALAAQGKKS